MFKSSITAALVVAVVAGSVGAQTLPNFAGRWEMDPAKSTFGQFPAPSKNVLVVTQTATMITVVQTMGTPDGDVTLNQEFSLEGKTTTGTGFGGAPTSTTAKLDSAGLSAATKFTIPGGDMDQASKWVLSADGKTLTIDQAFTSPMGEVTFHMVFDKKT